MGTSPDRKKSVALVVLLIGIAGSLPLVIYGLSIGRAKTVGIREALALLNAPASNAILVDVRTAEEYEAGHIDGADNWPLDRIQSLASKESIPERFRQKKLLLISDGGIESAWAAISLEALSFANGFSVEGGMQSWAANASTFASSSFSSIRLPSGVTTPPPFREYPAHEQLAAFLAGYVVKPIYMLLSLGLIIVLWRKSALDLAALGWGMVAFLVGESICWINFPVSREEFSLLEYFHSFGMVLFLGFLVFAVIEGMDRRILQFSDLTARCAFLGLCRGCAKYKPVSCGLRQLLKIGILALIALSFMLFNANPVAVSYNSKVFVWQINFAHPVLNQLYEIRFSPLAAILLLSISFALLPSQTNGDLLPSKILLSAGVGFLGFAFMRLALFAFYRDDLVWFAFWEEATELLLIGNVALVLWIFRESLVRSNGIRVPSPS